MKTKKIKITGCAVPTYWYAKKIGEVVEVSTDVHHQGGALHMKVIHDGRETGRLVRFGDFEDLFGEIPSELKAKLDEFIKQRDDLNSKIASTEKHLEELRQIKLEDIVPGAVFVDESNKPSTLIFTYTGKILITGCRSNAYTVWQDNFNNAEDFLKYTQMHKWKKSI